MHIISTKVFQHAVMTLIQITQTLPGYIKIKNKIILIKTETEECIFPEKKTFNSKFKNYLLTRTL